MSNISHYHYLVNIVMSFVLIDFTSVFHRKAIIIEPISKNMLIAFYVTEI